MNVKRKRHALQEISQILKLHKISNIAVGMDGTIVHSAIYLRKTHCQGWVSIIIEYTNMLLLTGVT